MNISRLLSILAIGALAMSAAACGDESSSGSQPPVSTNPDDTIAPPDDTLPPPDPAISHPTGADDVVIRIGYEGGFVPIDYLFLDLPSVLVTGDGRLITQGPVAAIYPGPLLPNMQVRTIAEADIQKILALAEQHGLLVDRQYTSPNNVADAPDTVVTITANGVTYRHSAYALGLADFGGPETDDARRQLAEFVDSVTGEWLYDGTLAGEDQPYESDAFLIRATPATDLSGYEIEPTLVEWPGAIDLATASECAEVTWADSAELFQQANQLTFFTQNDVTYSVAVKQQLPGDAC